MWWKSQIKRYSEYIWQGDDRAIKRDRKRIETDRVMIGSYKYIEKEKKLIRWWNIHRKRYREKKKLTGDDAAIYRDIERIETGRWW